MQNLKSNWLVQNWHEEFNKFWSKHSEISKICTLMGCFWPKYIMLQLRKYREVMFDGTRDCLKIFEGKLICSFKNDKNLVNFVPSTQKYQKFLLRYVLSGNLWPKKVQRSYLSWHWRVMQNLKENWLLLSKMTWGIWEIFTRALESLEIGTLIGFFCPNLKRHELKIYWWVMRHEN